MGDLSMVRREGGGLEARSAGPRTRQRSALRALALVLGAFLAAAMFTAQARALEFVRPAGANGQFFNFERDADPIHIQRIAVDHASGNVLVTNVADDVIDVYDSTSRALLTSFGAGELTDPFGIAVDQRTGAVYVSDAGRDRIVRYTVTAGTPPTYTLDGAFTSPGLGSAAGEIGDFAAALAIDASADKLLVADPGNNLVKRFTLAGAYDSFSFNGGDSPGGAFTGLLDLAVDSTGDVIVVDSTGDVAVGPPATSRVLRFSATGAYEDRIGPSLVRPATVAVRPAGDHVLVSANQDSVNRDEAPTVDAYSARGIHLASVAWPQFRLFFNVVTGIAFDDGPTGRLYVATDVDRTNAFLPDRWGEVSVQIYDTIPTTPPTFSNEAAQPAATEATINATIATNGSPVTYYAEYGLVGSGYTERSDAASLTASGTPSDVRIPLSGLTPNSAYEFRIVADNLEEVVVSPGATFSTLPELAIATVKPATGVTRGDAMLNGTVDLRGAPGSYAFIIQQVGGPLRVEFPRVDLPASHAVDVSQHVDGLSAGRTYRVGIAVLTAGGYALAEEATFATPGDPVFVDPARTSDPGSLYGCSAPRLDAVGGTARVGQELAVTGADLGIYGIVRVGGEQATIRSYSADRVTFVVPEGLSGRVDLTIDCGKVSGTVPVTIAGSGGGRTALKVTAARVRGKVATLRVTVPGAGTVTARGRQLSGALKRVSKRGTVILKVRLNRAGGRALARARAKRLRATIVVRHAATGGRATSVRKAVVFKR